MYDILIKNGQILNGTGSPAMRAQITIKDGKIAESFETGGDASRVSKKYLEVYG